MNNGIPWDQLERELDEAEKLSLESKRQEDETGRYKTGELEKILSTIPPAPREPVLQIQDLDFKVLDEDDGYCD